MKVLIEIDEEQKKMVDAIMELPPQVENDLVSAIRHGKPLPKGHGDLVDVSKINSVTIEGYCSITWKQGDNRLLFINAPTIIEADKENKE